MTTTGKQSTLGFMVCVNNSSYPASLELGKAYEVVPDESLGPEDIRVIDESGEDYIYPAIYFSSERQPAVSTQPPKPGLPSDIEREARGFVEENEPLLSEGSAISLGRVFVQGANIGTALSEEAVTAANRAAAVTTALAEAIRNPSTPAQRLHELETEHAQALKLHEHRSKVFQEFDAFLNRVSSVRQQLMDEGEEG
jgi:hypothetical protein